MSTSLYVIDPAVKVPELEAFNEIASQMRGAVSYHLPAMHGMSSITNLPSGPRGILLLGSSSSVHDEAPWQKALGEWLLPQLRKGVPTLGLCFGHQFISYLMGGKVGFVHPSKEKEVGFRTVSLEKSPITLKGSGQLFVSHRETVTQPAPGFRVLGRSDLIATDALAHETLPIWTFQSHPEACDPFIRRQGYTDSLAGNTSYGWELVKRFLNYLER